MEDRARRHAHVSCFKLWAEESRREAAPPRAVAAAPAGEPSLPPARDAVVPAWARTFALAFTVFAAALFAWGGTASATPVSPSLGGEPSLEGEGGLLDALFGLENLLRMDDEVDQLWGNPDVAHVRIVSKYSSYDQTIGYRRGEHGGAFVPLVTVSGSGPISSEEITFTAAESGADFRWSLRSIGPGAAPTPWSARADDNSDQRDHLVTWQVTGTEDHPDNILGSFVLGFEDLAGLGDADYNDVIAQVWGVTDAPLLSLPAPATLVLLLVGSAGAAGWRRLGRRA